MVRRRRNTLGVSKSVLLESRSMLMATSFDWAGKSESPDAVLAVDSTTEVEESIDRQSRIDRIVARFVELLAERYAELNGDVEDDELVVDDELEDELVVDDELEDELVVDDELEDELVVDDELEDELVVDDELEDELVVDDELEDELVVDDADSGSPLAQFLALAEDGGADSLFSEYGDPGHNNGVKAPGVRAWANENGLDISLKEAEGIVEAIDEQANGSFHLDVVELDFFLENGERAPNGITRTV